jgi:hypothetical protein
MIIDQNKKSKAKPTHDTSTNYGKTTAAMECNGIGKGEWGRHNPNERFFHSNAQTELFIVAAR